MSDRTILLLGVWLGILGALMFALLAHAQEPPPANILRPWDGFTVKTTWPAGTDAIKCESAPIALAQVGVVPGIATPIDGPPVSFVLQMPVAEVRCRACSSTRCSELSPNALQIQQRSRADCNGDGLTNVSDLVCYVRVIYGGQP